MNLQCGAAAVAVHCRAVLQAKLYWWVAKFKLRYCCHLLPRQLLHCEVMIANVKLAQLSLSNGIATASHRIATALK